MVTPVSSSDLSTAVKDRNYGLSSPGNIQSYLQVVDLMASKLRYIPVPEPAQQSVYASWYKQTYPDQLLSLAQMSNEGLVLKIQACFCTPSKIPFYRSSIG